MSGRDFTIFAPSEEHDDDDDEPTAATVGKVAVAL